MFISRATSASPIIIIGAVIFLVLGVAVFFIVSRMSPPTTLYLGSGIFDSRVAYTQAQREKGLGGVEVLLPNQAMIFTYPSNDEWKIWMKDMKIPIDIVWLDESKKVIYIVKNVQPEEGTSTIYMPKSDAQYVVELPAGTVEKNAIQLNETAVFDIDEKKVQ